MFSNLSNILTTAGRNAARSSCACGQKNSCFQILHLFRLLGTQFFCVAAAKSFDKISTPNLFCKYGTKRCLSGHICARQTAPVLEHAKLKESAESHHQHAHGNKSWKDQSSRPLRCSSVNIYFRRRKKFRPKPRSLSALLTRVWKHASRLVFRICRKSS